MYADFYQLRLEPFHISPDHRFCYSHSSYTKAKAYMTYALNQAEGFVMITGNSGTGKTTLIQQFVAELGSSVTVAMLMLTQLDADDLLRTAAYSFGLNDHSDDKAEIIQKLTRLLKRQKKQGKRALLIVDEAHNLSTSAMEELRLLTNIQADNQPLLQIFLLGLDSLRDLIQAPEMAQGHQRVLAAVQILPLTAGEVGDYIRHRLNTAGWHDNPLISNTLFPIIHSYSNGIPRTINLICSRLFLHAFVEEEQKIGLQTLRFAISELQQERLLPADTEMQASAFSHQVDNYTAAHDSPEDNNDTSQAARAISIDSDNTQTQSTQASGVRLQQPDETAALVTTPAHLLPAERRQISAAASALLEKPHSARRLDKYRSAAAAIVGVLAIGAVIYNYYDNATPVAASFETLQHSDTAANTLPQKEASLQNSFTPVSENAQNRVSDSSNETSHQNTLPNTTRAATLGQKQATDNTDPASADRKKTDETTTRLDSETAAQPLRAPVRQILFAYKNINITPRFYALLNELVAELKKSEQAWASVVGVVDTRGKASLAYKRNIAEQRARTVSDYLKENGVAPGKIRIQKPVDAVATAANNDAERNPEKRKPQRLVEVTVHYTAH